MKVLASAVSLEEAATAIDCGVDILDIKNPAEGSLGAQPPWKIREIAEYVGSRGIPVSAALGDLPFKSGTAALAAFGAAHLRVDYLKIGLHGMQTYVAAVTLLNAVRTAVRMVSSSVSLVAAGYGDYRRFGGLGPNDLVRAAAEARCEVVMLDTAIKDGPSLLDAMDYPELEAFVAGARRADLQVALAGSLRIEHLTTVRSLGVDIIGVRGGFCPDNNRNNRLDAHRIRDFIGAAHGLEFCTPQYDDPPSL